MTDETNPLTDMDLVEIYAASSDLEAERIVLLLAEEGIESHKHERSVTAIPVEAGHRYMVVVFENVREKAVQILKKAREDEILPANGSFLAD